MNHSDAKLTTANTSSHRAMMLPDLWSTRQGAFRASAALAGRRCLAAPRLTANSATSFKRPLGGSVSRFWLFAKHLYPVGPFFRTRPGQLRATETGCPALMVRHNGTELTSHATLHWLQELGVA